MKKTIKSILLMLVLASMIVASEVYGEDICYSPYGQSPEPEFNAKTSLITIVWVEGEKGLEATSSWLYDEETNTTVCVITARRPDAILGDPDMDSLGHELLHCLVGSYHDEDY